MKSPYDIILRPVLTEKSYDAMNDKKYAFEVAIDAGKTEIKMAVETVFGVKVASVNTVRVQGKIKRQGKDALELVPIAHNFNPQSGGKSPPILGAKMSDMGQRGPGFTNTPPAGATTQGGARRASAAPSALGGPTPSR